jgi:hypothetical protein
MAKKVTNNINLKREFTVRRKKLFVLARYYAAEALTYFQNRQLSKVNGEWWTNRTFQAAAGFFTKAFNKGTDNSAIVGFDIGHSVPYGKILTLGNNRRSDAITPIAKKFSALYYKDAQKIYKD